MIKEQERLLSSRPLLILFMYRYMIRCEFTDHGFILDMRRFIIIHHLFIWHRECSLDFHLESQLEMLCGAALIGIIMMFILMYPDIILFIHTEKSTQIKKISLGKMTGARIIHIQ